MKLNDFIEVSDNVNLDDYLLLYNDVHRHMKHPEWLGTFSKKDIKYLLKNGGKIWLYYDHDIPVCSFFYLPVTKEVLKKHHVNCDVEVTGSLGPIMVRNNYLGNGLQFAMLQVLNSYIKKIGKKYIFTKTHANNIYSIRNLVKDGYKIVDEYENERGLMLAFIK